MKIPHGKVIIYDIGKCYLAWFIVVSGVVEYFTNHETYLKRLEEVLK